METGKFPVSIYTGIPVYATNFRIIPFQKWKFFSGKMETLPLTDSSQRLIVELDTTKGMALSRLEKIKGWLLYGKFKFQSNINQTYFKISNHNVNIICPRLTEIQ